MKTITLLWGKIKTFLTSYPKTEFTEWEAGHKEKEAYKEERTKWKALQQINMFF